jgi:hypothetical protein
MAERKPPVHAALTFRAAKDRDKGKGPVGLLAAGQRGQRARALLVVEAVED